MTTQYILFFSLALIAVVSALGMLFSRNAVYSVLYLVLNFATTAVFFLLLHAPFIAIAQVSVYAGAIMVLFLFVIMLLGAERIGPQQAITWQRPVAAILGLVLLVEVGYILLTQFGSSRRGRRKSRALAAPRRWALACSPCICCP
jgi:NADH-quinone oxidoreductase subunit J